MAGRYLPSMQTSTVVRTTVPRKEGARPGSLAWERGLPGSQAHGHSQANLNLASPHAALALALALALVSAEGSLQYQYQVSIAVPPTTPRRLEILGQGKTTSRDEQTGGHKAEGRRQKLDEKIV
ncbi:hypothetical protein diail_9857 [Diaporthe ilicicola]|nr:hypothetical protein diail_9857 [Diaporthe ilicicola]